MNDSIYYGRYSIYKREIRMYFDPPVNEINSITGRLDKENFTVNGVMNDSIPVMIDLKRLTEKEDYLNNLYN